MVVVALVGTVRCSLAVTGCSFSDRSRTGACVSDDDVRDLLDFSAGHHAGHATPLADLSWHVPFRVDADCDEIIDRVDLYAPSPLSGLHLPIA